MCIKYGAIVSGVSDQCAQCGLIMSGVNEQCAQCVVWLCQE